MHYGVYSEIESLYSRFRRGSRKIKVVVDVSERIDTSRESFLTLYRDCTRVFPSISRHSCCEGWEAAPLYTRSEEGMSVKRIGELADYPHLLEHLMVDVQCSVGKMPSCSGITCGWKKPESRFDLFVECDDPRIGIFAACLGANLMNNFVAGNPSEDDFHLLLEVAEMIKTFPETKDEIAKLAQALNESVENINSALGQLQDLHFFDTGVEDDGQ
jgi:hypothetical protein